MRNEAQLARIRRRGSNGTSLKPGANPAHPPGSPLLAVCSTETTRSSGEKSVDVDDLLRRVRSGLDDGDLTLLYLWIRFRANGGGACKADLGAVLRGRQSLSDHDTLVLGTVIAELYDP
jgi:hypothetical protein